MFALLISLAFPSGLSLAQSAQKPAAEIEKAPPATPQEKPSKETPEKEAAEAEGEQGVERAKEPYSYDPTNKPDPFKSYLPLG